VCRRSDQVFEFFLFSDLLLYATKSVLGGTYMLICYANHMRITLSA